MNRGYSRFRSNDQLRQTSSGPPQSSALAGTVADRQVWFRLRRNRRCLSRTQDYNGGLSPPQQPTAPRQSPSRSRFSASLPPIWKFANLFDSLGPDHKVAKAGGQSRRAEYSCIFPEPPSL